MSNFYLSDVFEDVSEEGSMSDWPEWVFELAVRATSALERIASAEEKRNQLLEVEAAERREAWEQWRGEQRGALQRIAPTATLTACPICPHWMELHNEDGTCGCGAHG